MKKTLTDKTKPTATTDRDNGTPDLTVDKLKPVSRRSQSLSEPLAPAKQAMPKTLIAAIIGLVLLIGLVVYMNHAKNQATSISRATPSAALASDTEKVATDANAVIDASLLNESSAESVVLPVETVEKVINESSSISKTLEQDILSAPIPQSDALIKEEIQRMDDEHARLQEQEALLNEQMTMVGDINHKKEEQIALLEQRVALLEPPQ